MHRSPSFRDCEIQLFNVDKLCETVLRVVGNPEILEVKDEEDAEEVPQESKSQENEDQEEEEKIPDDVSIYAGETYTKPQPAPEEEDPAEAEEKLDDPPTPDPEENSVKEKGKFHLIFLGEQ